MLLSKQLDKVIDEICNRGCQYVTSILFDSTVRKDCEAFQLLDQKEQGLIIDELKMLMSVYDQSSNYEV